jgi:hypothetical protein
MTRILVDKCYSEASDPATDQVKCYKYRKIERHDSCSVPMFRCRIRNNWFMKIMMT